MTKKIFRSIIIVAIAVLLASYAIIMTSLYQYFTALQRSLLETQLDFAAVAVESGGVEYLESVTDGEYRLTLVDSAGTVIYDTDFSAEEMDNHADREEIREAMEEGRGESSRYSETLTEKIDYFATKLSDGKVLRISASHFTVVTLFMGMIQPMCVVIFIAVILSVILAVRISGKIVKPLTEISFEKPLDNDTYEELTPVLRHIDSQNKQIKKQIEKLVQMQSEFNAITENMSEGLVLLNTKGTVLSINSAAKKLFSADESCVGKDFVTVDRTPEINRCIQKSFSDGYAEIYAPKNGRDYLFRFSRTTDAGKTVGTVILIIDVTEKMHAEQMRREFTANVSHELKTPLQSIAGSADLIGSGLVKEEDIPRFVGHIKTDTERLVNLVNDIIRLSKLDENYEMSKEDVDLYAAAQAAVNTLMPIAAQKNVTVSLEGESTTVQSVRELVYEIVYNLCDNAVKYNKDGGSVKIAVHKKGGKAEIEVSDTGIGIAPEHQERVFERFYRVDKSRSKETGGTGLGLSIVKHAVRYLNGQVVLESKPGEGTDVTVILPG